MLSSQLVIRLALFLVVSGVLLQKCFNQRMCFVRRRLCFNSSLSLGNWSFSLVDLTRSSAFLGNVHLHSLFGTDFESIETILVLQLRCGCSMH